MNWHEGLVILDGPTTDEVRVQANDISINGIGFVDVDKTADVTSVGVINGLDQGSVAANTWLALHLISNDRGDEPESLLSLSATAPLLPTTPLTYTQFRRVGWRRIGPAGVFYSVSNAPGSNQFDYNEDTTAADFRVKNVTTSDLAFTDVSASTPAPPTCRKIWIAGQIISVPVNVLSLHLRENGLSNAGGVPWLSAGNVVNLKRYGWVGVDIAQIFEYHTDNTLHDVIIDVIGYEDIR